MIEEFIKELSELQDYKKKYQNALKDKKQCLISYMII